MTDKTPHIHRIREAVMMTLSVYAHAHESVTDAEMLGALSACFCEALVIKGVPLSDELFDTLRKTYDVVEIHHAMQEKQEETVQ